MKRSIAILALLCATLLAACDGEPPPPPEGFTLAIRFDRIDPAVVDIVRLSFRPEGEGEEFQLQEEMIFEDGAIVVRVEPDGSLSMDISGDHVRTHVMTTGADPIYELHVWSEDPAMNEGPLVFGTAVRGAEAIGEGPAYLPEWPPPVDGRQQLALSCYAEAFAAGRCMP
jgi:hypothetical protein